MQGRGQQLIYYYLRAKFSCIQVCTEQLTPDQAKIKEEILFMQTSFK